MTRRSPWMPVAWVAVTLSLGAAPASRAEEAAPPKPPAVPPATPPATPPTTPPAARPMAALAGRESRVMRAVLKGTGRVMLRYLEDKQDPEKAAAYEDVLRALGGVLSNLEPGDERAAVAAGTKALLDLMPTMNSPKRQAVMRDVMLTMAHAVAEGLEPAGAAAPGQAAKPEGERDAHVLVEAVLGGVADVLLGEISSQTFFGARLAAPAAGGEGFPVTEVRPGSKAEQFGLRAGDTIVRFGGAPATWRSLLHAALALHRSGEFPALTVTREGKPVELAVPPPAPRAPEAAPQGAPK